MGFGSLFGGSSSKSSSTTNQYDNRVGVTDSDDSLILGPVASGATVTVDSKQALGVASDTFSQGNQLASELAKGVVDFASIQTERVFDFVNENAQGNQQFFNAVSDLNQDNLNAVDNITRDANTKIQDTLINTLPLIAALMAGTFLIQKVLK